MNNNELQQIIVKIITFFKQNKNIKNKNITQKQLKKNQSNYSEDADYFNQNQQHSNNNPRNNNWLFFNQQLSNFIHVVNKDDNQDNLFLQDKIQPHTKKIFQSQNPMNTQNYQTKSIAKRNPITIIFTTT